MRELIDTDNSDENVQALKDRIREGNAPKGLYDAVMCSRNIVSAEMGELAHCSQADGYFMMFLLLFMNMKGSFTVAYQYQVNYQPHPVGKPTAFAELKKFTLPLCIVAFIEMAATITTIVLYYIDFDTHYLLIEVPVIILAALGMSFLIVKKTGRIRLGLLANLLLNFGYHIGAVIGVMIVFFASIPGYDGFLSLFSTVFIAIASFICCLFLIGINFLCGLPGVWLGKWQYRQTFKDGPGRNDRERNGPGDSKQSVLGDVEA